jgi:predicted transcriptional regulator
MKASDIMEKEVFTISKSASLEEAARKIITKHAGCLVVEKDGRPLGIVTREDIMKEIIAYGENAHTRKVSDFMSDNSVMVSHDHDLRVIEKFITEAKTERAIVLDGNRMVGFISEGSMLGALLFEQKPL